MAINAPDERFSLREIVDLNEGHGEEQKDLSAPVPCPARLALPPVDSADEFDVIRKVDGVAASLKSLPVKWRKIVEFSFLL